MTGAIVEAPPEIAGKLWLMFAGGLGTAPKPGVGGGGGASEPPALSPGAVPALSEALLRVRIISGLEAIKTAAYESVTTALREQNRAFFKSLGLTTKQINSILRGTSQYQRSFGTAVEAAMERAIRADSFLSKYVEYTANGGKVPGGVGKPDWVIRTQSSRIPVDVTTVEQAATRLRQLGMWSQRPKWYTEGGLNLTYQDAPPLRRQ